MSSHVDQAGDALAVVFGPRTAQVQVRIDQVRGLGFDQLDVIKHIHQAAPVARRKLVDVARDAAWDADLADAWATSFKAVSTGFTVAWAPVAAEVVAHLLKRATYLELVAPLELVLEPPQWWFESGSRNLFYEMLTQGVGVVDAATAVTALA